METTDVSKFTEKAQEAISLAQKMAEERNNTQLESEHLLLALVDQKDGVVPQILDKLNVDHTQVKRQLENELEKLAKASGPIQVYLSPCLKQVLDTAEKESRNFKDEYISTEHMLIGIIDQDTVDLQFDQLKKRLADRHIEVKLTEKAKELLVKEGYDPAYGARPLKRTIQRLVLDPLAVKVLKGEFKDGSTVVVDAKADNIIFAKKEIGAPTG